MADGWNGTNGGPPPRWLVWLTIATIVVGTVAWVLH
jgi:hypothetical protein